MQATFLWAALGVAPTLVSDAQPPPATRPGPDTTAGSSATAPEAGTTAADSTAGSATPTPTPVAPAPQPDPAPVPPPVSVAPASAPPASATTTAAPPSRLVPRTDAARLADAAIDGGKARWRPGTGVEVGSADGRFSLQFGALAQLQALARFTPGTPGPDGGPPREASNDFGLVFRRARLVFGGNLFSKSIKYKIQLTASPVELGWRSGTITRSPILDWYFTFDRLRDATFQVGQYKVPYNHQRMLRVTGMQFVDRSAANNEFTMDRDIGLDIRSRDVGGLGKLRYYAGVYLGDGIALHRPGDFGLAYVGRAEVLPFGQYDDLEEGDHDRLGKPRMLIGGAFAYIARDPHDQHGFGGQIPADGRKASTLNATADINFRLAGFSFEGAFFWRKAVKMTPVTILNSMGDPVAAVAPRDGLGYFLQAGYLLPRLPLELGARWGQVRGQGDATSLRDQNEVGGVFNYFFARHWLKLQLEYLHLWNNEIRYGTDQVRVQLQATF